MTPSAPFSGTTISAVMECDLFLMLSTQFSLDFVPENLENGDLRQSAAGVDILAAADGVMMVI